MPEPRRLLLHLDLLVELFYELLRLLVYPFQLWRVVAGALLAVVGQVTARASSMAPCGGDEEIFCIVVGRGRGGDAGKTEEARRGRLEVDDGRFLDRELALPVTELVAGGAPAAGSEALEVAGEEAELDEDAALERASLAHPQNGEAQ